MGIDLGGSNTCGLIPNEVFYDARLSICDLSTVDNGEKNSAIIIRNMHQYRPACSSHGCLMTPIV